MNLGNSGVKVPVTGPEDKKFNSKSYPRVRSGLTIKELRDECNARQLSTTGRNIKSALLELLVDDTILLSQTDAFKEVEWIKQEMKNEASGKYLNARFVIEERRQKEKEKQAKVQEKKRQKEDEDRQEKLRQIASFHSMSCPESIHGCKLAKAFDVGRISTYNMTYTCNMNGFNCWKSSTYTCTKCDFDVCQACFDFESLPEDTRREKLLVFEEQKRQDEIKRAKLEAEKQARIKAKQEQREKERQVREKELQAQKEREEKVRKGLIAKLDKPSKKIKHPNGKYANQSKLLSYVVWKSEGYDNDGWHSYQGPPDTEFDSTWPTTKEANSRAEYLFYVENPWGISEEEIMADDVDQSGGGDELIDLVVCPADSERWTVSADTKVDFQHLISGDSDSSEESFY